MHRLSFFLLLLLPSHLFAQDTLVLYNGRERVLQVKEITSRKIAYKKKEGAGMKYIAISKVFSVKYGDGREEVFYKTDTLYGGDFSIPQMRMFIAGEKDACKFYHNPWWLAGGIASGALGGALGGFYLFIPPATGVLIANLGSPDMQKQKVSDKSLLSSEEYQMGYSKKARDKKIKNATLGGILGLLTAIILLASS